MSDSRAPIDSLIDIHVQVLKNSHVKSAVVLILVFSEYIFVSSASISTTIKQNMAAKARV